MNCSKCNTLNEKDHLFCVSCGGHLAPPEFINPDLPPTVIGANAFPPNQAHTSSQTYYRTDSPDSIPTAFRTSLQVNPSPPNFTPSVSYPGMPPVKKNNTKFIWLGALVLLLLAGGGAYLLIGRQSASAEILPDHLGMFVQNKDKNGTSEIFKQDFTSAFTAKDDLIKSESLSSVESKPNLILYSDGKDIPLMDLKLVQLDTIKDDGTLKQINYQPSPVEGKPEMKRLRVPEGLANGKYAFALFDGFLDEGKHKLWAFQVKNSEKSDNGDLAKALTLSLKPKPSPTPIVKTPNAPAPPTTPSVPPPSGGQVAVVSSGNVVLRAGASQSSSKIGGLHRGQKVYVIEYSSQYERFQNLYSNYAYIQTDSGKRGWVYAAYIR